MLLIIAAILLIAIGLAHSVLGERYVLIRLFRREVPKLFGSETYTKRTLRFAWHITTVAWWGFAALLLASLEDPSRAVYLKIISVTFLVSGVVALVGSRGRHYSWVVFLAVAVLAWWAA
ncbi:MAG TPA: hypothetical protein VKP65_22785 [Rhodothermales bacterium]|nr:hypothetical protein [Rhodothermales bacterium]